MRRNTLLREQRTYPLLDLSKRRRPQRKRLLNRRGPRPRHSNHGCPWIQKSAKKATVMLGPSREQLRGSIGVVATLLIDTVSDGSGSTLAYLSLSGTQPGHGVVIPSLLPAGLQKTALRF